MCPGVPLPHSVRHEAPEIGGEKKPEPEPPPPPPLWWVVRPKHLGGVRHHAQQQPHGVVWAAGDARVVAVGAGVVPQSDDGHREAPAEGGGRRDLRL